MRLPCVLLVCAYVLTLTKGFALRLSRPAFLRTIAVGSVLDTNVDDSDDDNQRPRRPKVIIFDLDGCLWRPEMYELLYFSGGRGAPFRYSPDYATDGTLFTVEGEPVRLLGQVRTILRELYTDIATWGDVQVGISSRTDQPDWARELLHKFTITVRAEQEGTPGAESFALIDVFTGPQEIRQDSKVQHFQRISAQTGVAMSDILFFDNERGNCNDIAAMGAVVVCSPDGVTSQLWEIGLREFPRAAGQVLGLDVAPDYKSDYRRTEW